MGKKYNVVRHKQNNKIITIALQGFNKQPVERPINSKIRRQIIAGRCIVLGTGKPECDHKDGMLDDPRLSDINRQKLSDFQPLSKAANNAKRQHCKECRATGKRFDAKRLGFKRSQIKGDEIYRGTCIGCYWHDSEAISWLILMNMRQN